MNFSFENKTVVITGAGRGIGKATAIAFAKAGANVVLASKTQSNLDNVAAGIAEFNPNVMTYALDTKDKVGCEDLIAKTVERFGTVNIIVHAASDSYYAKLDNMSDDVISNHFDSNVNAARWLLNAAMPYLDETEGKGRFIAIGSVAGSMKSVVGMTGYVVAKAGLEAFIKQAAWEYGFANKQVLINLIVPGTILSDRALELAPREMHDKSARITTPLRRSGEPEEIANVCLFLASPGASYMHGSSIVVDGGYSLGTVMPRL